LSRWALVVLGLQILLICFGPPRSLEDWLNLARSPLPDSPRYLVVLGGGGVPSGSTLVRCYFAATIARQFTNTTVIVALPADGDPATSSVGRMRDELVLRGVPADAIRLASRGANTRQQADHIRDLLGESAREESVLVVTSHYHARRAVLCFRRAGFRNVTGVSAEEVDAEAEIGGGAWLRYGVWGNARSAVGVARELVALLVTYLS
jgi:uncharacterized SAM-binding protein YcdF (DUF218 family)